ncbi:FAD-binding protein [Spiribacter halobius]|uniref:FAD-linked oxidase n=1 Tax=Sediminicurvatus halobius TaxID=2182432 RepID=A0A2U2N4E3_9GAMM|nr:FAD-binding protein [Spiribacter halobius]PWG63962.1 FAD-linked oxidase [Spiribacter halobius]UEX76378.1 FAD-binding protein [Spiribacter halobius]
MANVRVTNWKRSIVYHAHSVEKVGSVEDIQRIVRDRERYPSPVRVKGSHHSTTRCVVAEGGTVIDITGMNRILAIDREACTITMEAGCQHIDAAKALEKEGLQFYVNVEIGNLTVGSGATGGTKDASYHSEREGWEFGQVAAYCIGVKTVQPDGSLREVTETEDPELMAAMRSSYGMLGIVYEVTFRVKPIRAMAVEHEAFHVDEFADRLDELIARNRSMMLYLFPFIDRVVVEWRYEVPGEPQSGSWQWRLRNTVWKTLWPGTSKLLGYIIPLRRLRFWLIDNLERLTVAVLDRILRDRNSSPADQIINYSELAGFASYTFSIWAFPRESYPQAIRDYFAFCKQYYRDNHYRCDMLNVGYHIAEDRQSLFSYTRRGPALTLDPVATGLPGWEGFLYAYNEFCSQHDGTPLWNQSGSVTPLQAQKAFGEEIREFLRIREQMDPEQRFYNEYFRHLFSEA